VVENGDGGKDRKMATSSDWRDLLSAILSNPAERERIANEIGIHQVTLNRWVSGETSPRPHNMRQLLRALPKPQRVQLLALFEKVSPEIADFEVDIASQEIAYDFLMEVLEARASIPDLLRFWTITRMVLQKALKQLDPERVGTAITVVRCMPPSREGKIRSLRETIGLGTPPWGGDLEEKALLLGAESLAGHVVVSCRMEQIGDLRINKTFLPAYQSEHEVSAVACPIMYACRVAGCLLISSTQPDYFAPESRLSLIQSYTNLLALAFDPEDFYSPECITLHIMPPAEIQQEYFAGFRQSVLRLMQEWTRAGRHLPSTQAEQLVWQQIEEALIAVTSV
jgi:transcriptional regulator with XRE-family HTH domain